MDYNETLRVLVILVCFFHQNCFNARILEFNLTINKRDNIEKKKKKKTNNGRYSAFNRRWTIFDSDLFRTRPRITSTPSRTLLQSIINAPDVYVRSHLFPIFFTKIDARGTRQLQSHPEPFNSTRYFHSSLTVRKLERVVNSPGREAWSPVAKALPRRRDGRRQDVCESSNTSTGGRKHLLDDLSTSRPQSQI